VSSDGWIVTIPRRSVEGSAGLEFPLEFPDHLDLGSFATQLFVEFDAEGFTVENARTVFVTVEGLLSANGQTEALEALHGPHQAASTGSTMSSMAILWVFSDEDPAFTNDFIELWNFGNSCVDIVTHGSTADCSFDAQQSLEQSLAFELRPDYRYWFRLMISETFAVRAGSFSVPEPGTLALLTLGLFGIAVTRQRRAA
jgi:hypothetical protein